jgi:hypothetical protein
MCRGEYGRNIVNSCMEMENETLWNYSKNGEKGDGLGDFN